MPKASPGPSSTRPRPAPKATKTVQEEGKIKPSALHAACYKRTFLKDVILRVDFGSRVDTLSKDLPQKVASAALKRFPISEPQKGHLQSFTISPTNVETSTQETTEWIYHGRDRKKSLILTTESLSITNTQYESFESLCEDYRFVLKQLFDCIPDLSISRVGLRYINILDIGEEEPLSWGDYINENTLGIINMQYKSQTLARVFHIVEFNDNGQQLRFQFGIANPDYPSPICRRQFVLDFDAYFSGDISQDELDGLINRSHNEIQDIFEHSITEKTRSFMDHG